MTTIIFDGVTHLSSQRALLDLRGIFKDVWQVNPPCNSPRIFRNSEFLGRTLMSRVPGKTSKVSIIVSVPQTDTGGLGE